MNRSNLLIVAACAFITSITISNPGLLDQVKGFFSKENALPLSVSGLDTSKGIRHYYDPAKRVKHWKTTVAALKAYGISRDSETMHWAYRNLNRAENAQPGYSIKRRRELGSTKYKKDLGRTVYDRPVHERSKKTKKERSRK